MHNEEIWKCQEIIPVYMEAKWQLYYLTIYNMDNELALAQTYHTLKPMSMCL